MMFDYVIVTHIPVFYKVNLYNELAKHKRIFVIFIASNTCEKRADDFIDIEEARFEYKVLHQGNFQDRKILTNLKSLRKTLKPITYKRLLLSGWDLPEFWYLAFTNKKSKNALALESTVNESKTTGKQGFIKRIFLSRIVKVFASGSLHQELLAKLGYNGEITITKGVGIINKPDFEKINRQYHKKFLYVGRLSKIKNLEALILVFNDLKECSLTIIGEGDQKEHLENIANKNIIFKPSIRNIKLKEEFLNHDVFILPSSIEPWGLVVEEALYFGLAVIISQNCGARDLISKGVNGCWIDPDSQNDIKDAILGITANNYLELVAGVKEFSINAKDKQQVEAYL